MLSRRTPRKSIGPLANLPKPVRQHATNEDRKEALACGDEVCPVCTEPCLVDAENPSVRTGCGHTFHTACLENWRTSCEHNWKNFSCPVCRASLTANFEIETAEQAAARRKRTSLAPIPHPSLREPHRARPSGATHVAIAGRAVWENYNHAYFFGEEAPPARADDETTRRRQHIRPGEAEWASRARHSATMEVRRTSSDQLNAAFGPSSPPSGTHRPLPFPNTSHPTPPHPRPPLPARRATCTATRCSAASAAAPCRGPSRGARSRPALAATFSAVGVCLWSTCTTLATLGGGRGATAAPTARCVWMGSHRACFGALSGG